MYTLPFCYFLDSPFTCKVIILTNVIIFFSTCSVQQLNKTWLPGSDVHLTTVTEDAGGLVRTHSVLLVHPELLFTLSEVSGLQGLEA